MMRGNSCAIALSTEAAPWFQTNAPGLIRTVGALFFPIGLVMIVLVWALHSENELHHRLTKLRAEQICSQAMSWYTRRD